MTIYSIRTSLGRELWWTTSRKAARLMAEQLTEVGDYVPATGRERGALKDYDLPVSVYKCSVVAATKRAVHD